MKTLITLPKVTKIIVLVTVLISTPALADYRQGLQVTYTTQQTVITTKENIFEQETIQINNTYTASITQSPLELLEEKTILRRKKYKELKNWSKSMMWSGTPKWIKEVIA